MSSYLSLPAQPFLVDVLHIYWFQQLKLSQNVFSKTVKRMPCPLFPNNKKYVKKFILLSKKPFTVHPSKCIRKWQGIFPDKIFHWQLIFSLAFKITSYIKLQFFQYKFLHNILYTNYKLFRLKYIDSPMCTFCNTTAEKISSSTFSANAKS